MGSRARPLVAQDGAQGLQKGAPHPFISVAIDPRTPSDRERLQVALQKLRHEDPALRVQTDQQTSQVIIAGTSELHLETIVDQLNREFSLTVSVGRPEVAYEEWLTQAAYGEGLYVRKIDGKGQYARAKIRLVPGAPGTGYRFVNDPVEDVTVKLYDGTFHEVDSSEMAFKIAGTQAFQDAAKRAKPVILEPIMRIRVVVPTRHVTDVILDLSSRRGRIQSQEDLGGLGVAQVILAHVPLAEMPGCSGELRATTDGRATYSTRFEHYEPAPLHTSEGIVARKKMQASSPMVGR